MFANYSKQIYKELIKQDFTPFVTNIYETLSDDTISISLIKITTSVVYVVNILNAYKYSPTECMGKIGLDRSEFLIKYKKIDINSVNIFLNTDASTVEEYIKKLDKEVLHDFRNIYWGVNTSANKPVLYCDINQPSKVIGIERIINNLNLDGKESVEEEITKITAKALIDSPLRVRLSLFNFYSLLVILNTLIFFAIYLTDGITIQSLMANGAFSYDRIVNHNEYYRIITSMFLHGSIMHLLSNMLTLYIFGRGLETTTSHVNFLGVYFLSGLVANITMLLFPSNAVMVGASGCIFGLIGATLVLTSIFKRSIFGLNFSSILTIALVNFAASLSVPEISFQVHLIGFITGCILGYVYALDIIKSTKNKH